ncbi:hypothetical protein PTKIN_Ptkin05aG0112000 [Pterospermum kingtungense]
MPSHFVFSCSFSLHLSSALQSLWVQDVNQLEEVYISLSKSSIQVCPVGEKQQCHMKVIMVVFSGGWFFWEHCGDSNVDVSRELKEFSLLILRPPSPY